MIADPRDRLPRVVAVIEEGRAQGRHLGAQVYVSVHGEPVADFAFGEDRTGVPLASDALMLWLSAGKPIAAVAVARLWERGLLELDQPVADILPEFAANGKAGVTLRHVLTHTGGFPRAERLWRLAPWDEILARITAAPLEAGWIPGQRAGYHVASGWYVLGEVVRRLDGRPFEEYVREEIFEPLGMFDSWIGMPAGRFRAYGDRIASLYDTHGSEARLQALWSSEEGCVMSRPGGNARGPVRELGVFYETLLQRGVRGGVHLLFPQTVEALTARHRVGLRDETFGHMMDWGLGFRINPAPGGDTSAPYGYGPYASTRTFGHGGSQSSCGFCDPERGLVVAWTFNGMPGETRHDRRLRAMNAAVYEDLEAASAL